MFNRNFFRNIPPVTRNILILNIIIWAFAAIAPQSTAQKLVDLGGLHYFSSYTFYPWQFVTYMFIQVDFWHLFFNMWAVLMFGYVLEQTLGSKRYTIYYLVCGIGAGLIQTAVYAYSVHKYAAALSTEEYNLVVQQGWMALKDGYNYVDTAMGALNIAINGAVTIGASGAVFGILLAFGMLYPNAEMYMMFIPYPIKAKWMVIGYGILELVVGVGGINDGVAHFAHLGGLIFGLLLILYWRKKGLRLNRY